MYLLVLAASVELEYPAIFDTEIVLASSIPAPSLVIIVDVSIMVILIDIIMLHV